MLSSGDHPSDVVCLVDVVGARLAHFAEGLHADGQLAPNAADAARANSIHERTLAVGGSAVKARAVRGCATDCWSGRTGSAGVSPACGPKARFLYPLACIPVSLVRVARRLRPLTNNLSHTRGAVSGADAVARRAPTALNVHVQALAGAELVEPCGLAMGVSAIWRSPASSTIDRMRPRRNEAHAQHDPLLH